jgi:hypothetical protein
MLIVKNKIKGFKPLCYVNNGLLLSKNKKIFKCDLNLNNVEYLCEIPSTFKERVASKNRLIARIFRLHVRYALNIRDKYILLVYDDQIWRISLDSIKVTLDFTIPKNRTALYLTLVKGKVHQEDKIVFGEYFSNPDKKVVNIWSTQVHEKSDWRILNKFNSKEINHVHNIICDEKSDNCYVFTGDFGDGAAIWKTSRSFKLLTTFLRGKQEYRACWAIINNGKMSYATDTQLELNSFCKVTNKKIKNLQMIEGSSIYFGQNTSAYYFSTTVEPDEPSGNFVRDVFSYKLGKGIVSNRSKVYSVDDNDYVNCEFEAEKDLFPTRLAQFGSFTFPSGLREDERIIAYGVALKKYDDYCLLLERK